MFGFLKKRFFTAMAFFSYNVSMNNQECKVRTKIINIKNNELLLYPYSIEVNKFSGSCNNINDPYSKLCVPDVLKNINVKIFNLMSRTNATRHTEWHETCKCKCKLDASVFVTIHNVVIIKNADMNVKN